MLSKRKIICTLISFAFVIFFAKISHAQKDKNARNKIDEIYLEGSTVLSSDLQKIIDSYKDRTITSYLLSEIKQEINELYISKGYLSSGVFTPPQEFKNGRLNIFVIEGSLTEIRINGLRNLNDNYITSRLPTLDKPLNSHELENSLNLLEEDPLIADISAEVIDRGIGKNALLVEVREKSPIQASLRLTDSYSPSIGNFGGKVSVTHNNLLGFGDRFNLSRTQTEGLRRTGGFYSVPLDSRESRITFKYDAAYSEVQTEELEELGINADSEVYSFSLDRSVIFRDDEKFFLGIKLEHIDSESFILDDLSFAFTEGLSDGEIKITALRFSQNYSKKWSKALLTFNSQFNFGIDLFDATVSDRGIDGIFSSWQTNFQYLLGLDKDNKIILVTRLATQLSTDTLVPTEQFTIGGEGTVPGYRRNIGNADNGVTGMVSLRIPLTEEKWGTIAIIPFVGAGGIWNNDRETTGANFLASLGAGLSYQLSSAIEFRLNYAVPLVEPENFENTSTTDNITILLNVRPINF